MPVKITHVFDDLTAQNRPQDPMQDGTGLTFQTMEHGGAFPDTMPQAILVTDAEGRSCTYVPVTVNGVAVKSISFELVNDEPKKRKTRGTQMRARISEKQAS